MNVAPINNDLPLLTPEKPSSRLASETAIFTKVEPSLHTPSAPLSLKNKLKDAETAPTPKISGEIEQELTQAAEISQSLDLLKQNADQSTTTQTISTAVQFWVSDMALKGGAYTAQSGLPYFLNTSAEALQGLIPATEIIKIVTDIVDVGTGFASSLLRAQILDAAKVEINKLKARKPPLEPEQFARLQALEKMLKYEDEIHHQGSVEQGVRSLKNIFSFVTFIFSWISNNPIAQGFTNLANSLIAGVNAALFGLWFYNASQDLKVHREWGSEFKAWIIKQTASFKHSEPPKVLQKQMEQVLNQRAQRKAEQREMLKERLEKKEITIDLIKSKIVSIKQPVLHQFLNQLKFEEITPEKFCALLAEKIGTPVKPDSALALYDAARAKEKVQEKLEKLETSYLQHWIDHQDQESLISTYMEYHAILDPAIKQSLAQMVEKKHQVEKSFLEEREARLGTQFTAATVVFAIALTLAIIACVANPIGGALLIMAILSLGTFLLSTGLYGAALYHAYQLKPGITVAMLKGSYIRLYYYYARSKIAAVSEKIGESITAACKEKRDSLASVICKLPVVSHLYAKKQVEGSDESEAAERLAIKKKSHDEFQKRISQAQHWADRAKDLADELEVIAWRDFARQADLQVASPQHSFDTLETLNHLLVTCDFKMLSADTKQLIEKQLGIDVTSLEVEIEKNPLAFKRKLREFFNMNTAAFVTFVGQQRIDQPQQSVRT